MAQQGTHDWAPVQKKKTQTKKTCKGGGSKGRLQRRNTETLPRHAGMVLGKEKQEKLG